MFAILYLRLRRPHYTIYCHVGRKCGTRAPHSDIGGRYLSATTTDKIWAQAQMSGWILQTKIYISIFRYKWLFYLQIEIGGYGAQ